MKKKGLLVFLLIAVMLSAIALSGCSLVTLNKERQANRIMATVSDTLTLNKEATEVLKSVGITDYTVTIDINRRELITSANYIINQYQSLYQQYYGTNYSYDYETVLSDTLDSIISNRYYVIRAMEELLNNSSKERLAAMYMVCRPEEYKAVYGNKISPEGVLTIAEWYAAVGSVNKTFQNSLESYIDDETEKTRNDRISDADNKISEYYEQGYFVSGVSILKEVEQTEEEKTQSKTKEAYKNLAGENEPLTVYAEDGTKYQAGLYLDSIVLTGAVTSDDSASDAPESTELDYKKIFAAVELTLKKSDGKQVVYVPRPVSGSVISITRVSDAEFVGRYVRTRNVTVSYAGRVYAKVTADNDTGYTSETFTSDGEKYQAVFPRSALTEKEEEIDYLEKEDVRYASKADWEDFLTVFDVAKKELLTDSDKYKNADEKKKLIYDGLADLYSAPFSTIYTGSDKNEKDAYRQLRTALSSANIGFVEELPEDADKNGSEYKNYTYYNGLFVHYSEQFMNYVLSALSYEKKAATEVTYAEIDEAYKAKVLKNKVNYDSIGYSDQLSKFFSDNSDIAETYYVPMAALKTQYEIKPTDKAYKALFTFDNAGNVTGYNNKYVIEKDGKYYMSYIYDNGDGTYTINAFFVGHILFSFENVERLNNAIVDSGASIGGYKDLDEDEKLKLFEALSDALTTNKQIATDGTLQENVKVKEELFEVGEDGKLVEESVNDVIARFEAAIAGKTREEVLKIFEEYTVMYNDDSGKMKDPGYLVLSGDLSDGWVADFSNVSKEIYYTLLAQDKDPNEELTFASAYGPYGRHYIMISFAPYYNVKLTTYNVNGETVYALDRDTVLNNAGDTQTDTIGKSLKESKGSAAYSDWQAQFTDEAINNATTRNEKNYKQLLKDIKNQ